MTTHDDQSAYEKSCRRRLLRIGSFALELQTRPESLACLSCENLNGNGFESWGIYSTASI